MENAPLKSSKDIAQKKVFEQGETREIKKTGEDQAEKSRRTAEIIQLEISSEKDAAEKMKKIAAEQGLDISESIEEKEDSVQKLEGGLGGMSMDRDISDEESEQAKKRAREIDNEVKKGLGGMFDNEENQENEKETILTNKEMLDAGKDFQKNIKEGEPVAIREMIDFDKEFIADVGSDFQFKAEFGGNTMNFKTEFALGNKLAEGKYLNIVDGKLIVCDFEKVKKVVDEMIKNKPDMIDKFRKDIEDINKNKAKIPEIYQYIQEKYLSK